MKLEKFDLSYRIYSAKYKLKSWIVDIFSEQIIDCSYELRSQIRKDVVELKLKVLHLENKIAIIEKSKTP